jgi:hypothetical protein
MSDDITTTNKAVPARRRRGLGRDARPDIVMSDGRVFRPRFRIAAEAGVDDKTLKRKHCETRYVGNLAYCEINSALAALLGEPKQQRQRRARRSAR